MMTTGCARVCVLISLMAAAGTHRTAVVSASSPEMRFTDVSAACGMDAVNSPAPAFFPFSIFAVGPMVGGAAVGDFNRDGFSDVFFVSSGGAPDRLFINNRDGTFTDRAAEWGVAAMHLGVGASVGDYNRDGWPDIFVTSAGDNAEPQTGRHRLYRNNAGASFTEVASGAGVNATGIVPDGFGSTWGDYDLDGDLDLFVAGWVQHSAGNRLFRNNADGTFTDVTDAAGFELFDVRGFSPALIDMDGDRYPELVIAADFGTSQYYRNNGDGTFTRWTSESGTGLDGNGMGSAVGDFDLDGRLDWYVTSIFSQHFAPGTGNMLYMNTGVHAFAERSLSAGVKDGGWGWGTVAVDLDHDGFEDIAETNGWPFANDLGALEWDGEPSYLWRNNADGTFAEVHAQAGLSHTLQGRGLVHLDVDNDGDHDLGFVAFNDEFRVFRNDLSRDAGNARWLKVDLDTSANPFLAPDGIGSVVRVSAASAIQHRAVHAMCHYLSTSEVGAHFGLGSAASIDAVRVEWANGLVTVVSSVASNQRLTIRAPKPGDADTDGRVGLSDLARIIERWGQTTWDGDVTGDGAVDLADVIFTLSYWAS